VTAQLHAAAVLERLRTSGSPAITVHDTKVPDGAVPPYVLVRFTFHWLGAADRADASNINMVSRALEVTPRLYCVATTGQGVRALLNRTSTALLNWRMTVAGRTCTPFYHLDSFETPPDERTGTDYVEFGDDYRCTSHPA
jgi:hypothetical protein